MRVMGILNVTPDSFYDGGLYPDPAQALEHAVCMVQHGADIIDVGGESSRPGAQPVSVEEEIHRVIPVIEALHQQSAVKISIDTTKAAVAERAIQAGASMVNDISALRSDPRMSAVVRDYHVDVVLMHMQGTPSTMQHAPVYTDVIQEIMAFLHERAVYALHAHINPEHIYIDPGICFGKTVQHNIQILKQIAAFKQLGFPLVVGVSRKSLFEKLFGLKGEERLIPSLTTNIYCWMHGVDIVRVHDVAEHTRARDTLRCVTESWGTQGDM